MMEDVYTNDEVVFASTAEEFQELVHHFVKYPNERLPYIRRGYETVMNNHTYFHRVSKMLSEFGLESESVRCLEIYEEVKKMMGIEV
jgi:spore maturation protein CgeB